MTNLSTTRLQHTHSLVPYFHPSDDWGQRHNHLWAMLPHTTAGQLTRSHGEKMSYKGVQLVWNPFWLCSFEQGMKHYAEGLNGAMYILTEYLLTLPLTLSLSLSLSPSLSLSLSLTHTHTPLTHHSNWQYAHLLIKEVASLDNSCTVHVLCWFAGCVQLQCTTWNVILQGEVKFISNWSIESTFSFKLKSTSNCRLVHKLGSGILELTHCCLVRGNSKTNGCPLTGINPFSFVFVLESLGSRYLPVRPSDRLTLVISI